MFANSLHRCAAHCLNVFCSYVCNGTFFAANGSCRTLTAILADKAYDAAYLCDKIDQTGGAIVIPPKRNRKNPRTYDTHLYKERNRVERFFAELKQFRRAATRYDKLFVNFMGFVKIAAIAIWLR
jgi:putative transposase